MLLAYFQILDLSELSNYVLLTEYNISAIYCTAGNKEKDTYTTILLGKIANKSKGSIRSLLISTLLKVQVGYLYRSLVLIKKPIERIFDITIANDIRFMHF